MHNLTVYFYIRASYAAKCEDNGEKFYKQSRKCTWNVTLRCVHATIVVIQKQCVTYSECVFVAIGIQHAMLMRHAVFCGLSICTIIFHAFS
jgi:hypothetical protein